MAELKRNFFEDFPEYKAKALGDATLDAVRRFLAQPGGKEILDKKIAERKARQANAGAQLQPDGLEKVLSEE